MTSFNKFTRLVVQKAAIEKSFVLGHAAVLADIGMNRLQNVARPTNSSDAATKGYVDDLLIGSDGGGINVLDPPALAFTDTDMMSYSFNFADGINTVPTQMVFFETYSLKIFKRNISVVIIGWIGSNLNLLQCIITQNFTLSIITENQKYTQYLWLLGIRII